MGSKEILHSRLIRGEVLGPGLACPNVRPCYLPICTGFTYESPSEIPSAHAFDSARLREESHRKSVSHEKAHVCGNVQSNLPARPQVALLYLHAHFMSDQDILALSRGRGVLSLLCSRLANPFPCLEVQTHWQPSVKQRF